ncbi:hypothetical protein TGAM01_v207789 [Trichoderma gamsii]|uniref:RRM domain-containing protein n=1 Tax=Trichoderma gamsii TaxID=398673 RepID=A0A2P4ZG57_9HYPO|nr:hypothetical protein TGAM01_v207789 [Trichoderma gamsii]PON23262.1 hypothetical protein TGAM01_v207789 [Trichoderma gamsii]
MPRYNPQWENQIKTYRKNRVLIVVRSLPFSATTTQVESAIRARLTKPDSATFLWPPGATRPDRHISWVMLAFSRRPDTQMALEELQNFEIRGRPIHVERAHKDARHSCHHGTLNGGGRYKWSYGREQDSLQPDDGRKPTFSPS